MILRKRLQWHSSFLTPIEEGETIAIILLKNHSLKIGHFVKGKWFIELEDGAYSLLDKSEIDVWSRLLE